MSDINEETFQLFHVLLQEARRQKYSSTSWEKVHEIGDPRTSGIYEKVVANITAGTRDPTSFGEPLLRVIKEARSFKDSWLQAPL